MVIDRTACVRAVRPASGCPYRPSSPQPTALRLDWMDMDDRSLVRVMVGGIGSHLTNEEKRAHLADLRLNISSIRCAFKKYFRPRDSYTGAHLTDNRGGVIPFGQTNSNFRSSLAGCVGVDKKPEISG
jgi:hypothetical protein